MNIILSWPKLFVFMALLFIAQLFSYIVTLLIFKMKLVATILNFGAYASVMLVQFLFLNLAYLVIVLYLPKILKFKYNNAGQLFRKDWLWIFWILVVALGFSFQIVGSELENIMAEFTGRNNISVRMIHELARLQGMPGFFLAVFFLAVCPPLFEEIFFRHIMQNGLKLKYGANIAIVITSLIFAAIHMNVSTMPSIFLLSLVLGLLYEEYNLLASMVLHSSVNLSVVILNRMDNPPQGLNIDNAVAFERIDSGLLLLSSLVFFLCVYFIFRGNMKILPPKY